MEQHPTGCFGSPILGILVSLFIGMFALTSFGQGPRSCRRCDFIVH